MVRVENIYYLLCYAWEHADLAAQSDVAGLGHHRVADLLGHVLATRLGELLRRGLHREYVTYDQELRSPRGKLDIASTMKRALRPAGRVACVVDEFDYDVLLNQIVAATLERIIPAVTAPEVADALMTLARHMPPVSRLAPSAEHFRRVRLSRLTGHYGFVLHLCELILQSLVPTAEGRHRFIDFTGDERAMGLLFEAFVREFWRREQKELHVGRDTLCWPLEPITRGSAELLPVMHTDITLTAAGATCIVETKFYGKPLRIGRDGQRKLRESHLYQLLAYMNNMEAARRPVDIGVVLYAAARGRFDHRYRMAGRELRVVALDLDQPWQAIHADLLALSTELTAGMKAAAERRRSAQD